MLFAPPPVSFHFEKKFAVMCNCKYQCSQIFEVTTSGGNVPFPESNRVRDSRVSSVMVMEAGGILVLSPTGKSLAVDLVLQSSYAYFVNSNGTQIAQIPLAHLVRNENSPEPLQVDWREIDLTQSYVVINTGVVGYSATAVFVFTIGFDCNACGVSTLNK